MTGIKHKILIVDPNAVERTVMATYLRNENFYIEACFSLKEAIKRITEGCFKCIVMDVEIPEMKGYEAVSIIKGINPEIKIIMTTAKNTKSLEAKVRKQDIFFYFIKSFAKEELKLAINDALNK